MGLFSRRKAPFSWRDASGELLLGMDAFPLLAREVATVLVNDVMPPGKLPDRPQVAALAACAISADFSTQAFAEGGRLQAAMNLEPGELEGADENTLIRLAERLRNCIFANWTTRVDDTEAAALGQWLQEMNLTAAEVHDLVGDDSILDSEMAGKALWLISAAWSMDGVRTILDVLEAVPDTPNEERWGFNVTVSIGGQMELAQLIAASHSQLIGTMERFDDRIAE